MLPGAAKLPCSKACRCHHGTALRLQYPPAPIEAPEKACRHVAEKGVTKLYVVMQL